jgi:hypothetical protein
MLSRILAFSFSCALALVACKRSAESTLVGMWRVTTEESAGKIRFDANHTFTGGEWSLTATHQPPVIPDDGEWHVKRQQAHGLYMAALVAAHHNPILRNFYLRLRAAGKPAKLALTATMQKLLIVLNSTLKTDLNYA